MKTLNLHSRQKNLLSVLNKKQGAASGKELAAALDVSERTVRSDIKEINSQLEEFGIQICPQYGKGYSLSIRDRSIFVQLFSEKESYASKDDRVRTLLIHLLRGNDWFELGTLEDEMFVSRTTLENDLKTVKKKISARHPYLQMERKGNFVRLENNEIKRRDILIQLYAQYWDYYSRDGIVINKEELNADILRSIQNVLKKALRSYNVSLDDSAFIYLTLSIAIMYYRIVHGNAIRHTTVSRPDSDISELIAEVISTLNKEWQIEIRRAELIWLSDILKQLIQLCDMSYSKNHILESTDVICHQIVNSLFDRLYIEYGIDFSYDDHLFVDLTRHVQALFDGVVAPQVQNHILGDELRRKYPFQGDIVHFTRKYLEKQCEIDLGDDEEDYLYPFIISADRHLRKHLRKGGIVTCVISHTNGSVTHYIMEQLNSRYKGALDLRGPYPIHAKERCLDEKPELIISTVQIKNIASAAIDIPVITISPILEKADRDKIDRYIDKFVCETLFGRLPHNLNYYFKPDLLWQLNNKESLITTLSSIKEHMQAKRYIGKNVRCADPDRDYSSLLKNGFLFIYQIENSISEPVVSLVSLKRTISWKHLRSVQSIMYMILPEKCKFQRGWFYHLASYMSEKANFLNSLELQEKKNS